MFRKGEGHVGQEDPVMGGGRAGDSMGRGDNIRTRSLASAAEIVKVDSSRLHGHIWKPLNTMLVKICPNPMCRSPSA